MPDPLSFWRSRSPSFGWSSVQAQRTRIRSQRRDRANSARRLGKAAPSRTTIRVCHRPILRIPAFAASYVPPVRGLFFACRSPELAMLWAGFELFFTLIPPERERPRTFLGVRRRRHSLCARLRPPCAAGSAPGASHPGHPEETPWAPPSAPGWGAEGWPPPPECANERRGPGWAGSTRSRMVRTVVDAISFHHALHFRRFCNLLNSASRYFNTWIRKRAREV